MNEIVELARKNDIPSIPDIPSVIDNLVSSSAADALSANQGRLLKGLIDSFSGGLTVLYDYQNQYLSSGKSYAVGEADLVLVRAESTKYVSMVPATGGAHVLTYDNSSGWTYIGNTNNAIFGNNSYTVGVGFKQGDIFLGIGACQGRFSIFMAPSVSNIDFSRSTDGAYLTGYSFT